MIGNRDVTYKLDFRDRNRHALKNTTCRRHADDATGDCAIPRIARLMALAIRFEAMLVKGTIQDYAELARLGQVTRARITQIMKLGHLAPDIQEQILFLPHIRGMNERNLRPIVGLIDWRRQRRMFQTICGGKDALIRESLNRTNRRRRR